MEIQEMKEGLWSLTKTDVIGLFPRLELKQADNKETLIEHIVSAELSPEEIENLKNLLETKSQSNDEIPIQNSYIVIHAIKEDGKLYEPGADYKGKRAEYFLKGGQIRIKKVDE